jgi:hypothetical protein
MNFLIQNEKELSIEARIVKDIIDDSGLHSYTFIKKEDLNKDNKSSYPEIFEKSIPIGTIEFVDRWLQIFKGIERQYPIEIPEILRTEEFLKRSYSFKKYEDIPKSGQYFLKDISKLKEISYSGHLEHLDFNELDKTHLYQISEYVNILSEYRVYIIDGKISAISHYDGDPLLFPDTTLIKKANGLYSTQKNYPKSYTMDIMISEKGTSLVEIHPFNCVGFYTTLFGKDLLYAYRDWLNYIESHNKKIDTVFNLGGI